jgi:DNA-binding LytR/AlgR family response regulator
VRHEGTWTKIIFDEILYIQALGDYATIFTTASKYTIHATMKAMDEKLPTERFQRIHRSYIVAVSKISQINDNMVTVTDKNIPIAESFKEQLLEKLDLFN